MLFSDVEVKHNDSIGVIKMIKFMIFMILGWLESVHVLMSILLWGRGATGAESQLSEPVRI